MNWSPQDFPYLRDATVRASGELRKTLKRAGQLFPKWKMLTPSRGYTSGCPAQHEDRADRFAARLMACFSGQ